MIARVLLAELPEGTMRRLPHPPYDVLVVRTASGIFAIEDACPHSGTSLSGGELAGDVVICPAHGWEIDACTGCVLTAVGAGERAPKFDVAIEDAWIVVRRAR